ncbi:diguanylate cyclase domain-containing protein [Neptunomonas antarctica]|uniref:PAS domain S-box-containing protein/diguanylate cyclase (GGDEF) domain-containing protein n=1 Tax=Neptunomonas antarctica TaxID=619304 RepID=A0A1N7K7P7_9GAMM|nr:diguanylate cyclase [Neptunomonas antarctica]SIS57590.1 PAS domain S-box-containing protein/diguanylate cyclase (GGDEF) domain-containing protein [Neptunomonas antarctica]
MSINLKLALPPLLGLVLIILLLQIYWQPMQLEKAKSTFEKHTHALLLLGEAGIIQNLLERDLGALFAGIEHLENSDQTRWKNITLYNDNGKQLYPIFKRNPEKIINNNALILITHPLNIQGTPLGRLEFDADWGREKLDVIENINDVRNMVILLVVLSLLISTFSQYRIIYRPLKRLGIGAHKIAQGNFNVKLPATAKDEIGELTDSFCLMMEELAFQKKSLDEHAIVSATDRHGVITYVNNKFLDISGYTREDLIGKTHRVITSNTHEAAFYRNMWETITRGDTWHGAMCDMKKTGENFWASSTIIPFLNAQGVAERYMCIRTDITDQKLAEQQLRYMANHDSLTGLPTRRLCKENLSTAIAIARREKNKVAILFIDLDGFKAINDTLGHEAGDLLLMSVAERLALSLREADTVARIGGDEFLIILNDINYPQNTTRVAQTIINSLAQPFTLNNNIACISASIGIALYPDHEQEPEALIKRADEVMYAIKLQGKNNYAFPEDLK